MWLPLMHRTCQYIRIFLFHHQNRSWCSGIMHGSHSCDPGSIPGGRRKQWSVPFFCLFLDWPILLPPLGVVGPSRLPPTTPTPT